MTNRHFQASQLRGVNRDARTVEIVASDYSLDSYGTRIDPLGWDLEQFKKNPVICLQHDSYRALPVANAIPESIRVDGGKLLMTVQFPPEGTSQNADEAFNLIAAGVLRGVSVGFDPQEHEDVEENEGGFKKMVRIYRKQKLLETSFVTIPSNDNGLVVRARELNADLPSLKAQTEALEGRLLEQKTEDDARAALEGFKASHLLKCLRYFENKQKANAASTKTLDRFFKKVLKEEIPTEEVAAWTRMSEAIEAMGETETKEVVQEETKVETVQEEVVEATAEKPTESVIPVPAEAPRDERKASVQIPLSFLKDLPTRLSKTYVDAGVEALRRGLPLKDAKKIIDGLNENVSNSFSPQS